jgi:hypothetical protein
MKLLRVSAFVSLLACTASNAWAQYGLYGAPEMLRLQPVPAATASNTAVAPSAFQAESASSGPTVVSAYSSAAGDYSQPTQTAGLPPVPPVPGSQPKPAADSPSGQPGPVPSALADPGYQPSYTTATPSGCAAASGAAECGGYCGALNQYQQAACGMGCDGCNCCQWYGSVLALAMTRDRANKLWTTAASATPANQLMNTQDASANWVPGGEIRIGRCFCCNQYAIEADFWGLHEMNGFACASVHGGYVNTPLQDDLMYFHGLPSGGWFDGAQEHRLWRTDEAYNVELNFIRNHLLVAECGCPLSVDLLAGVRYFRFRDNLTWGTLKGGCTWGEAGGADEAYINDAAANNLIGGQLGFNLEYRASCCLKFFVTPKVGIYDNIIENNFGAQLGDCTIATQNSYPGLTYPVHSTANSFSVLTQIDVGADWQITPRLGAILGYRVLAATGMGLADNQIPFYFNDIPAIQDIDRNGHLILHGAFAGLSYCF